LKFHPLSELFPLMQGREFDELVADIKANGLLEPIWMYQGQILDGRNRWRACEAAEVSHRPMREYEGDDPVSFVVSLNLHRRHLDESQRGLVASRLKEVMSANLHSGDSTAAAAEALNVSRRTVFHADKVRHGGARELEQAVESGAVSVSAAADVAELPKEEQREIVARGEKEILEAAKQIRQQRVESNREHRAAEKAAAAELPVPTGRYRTIVIDPPWEMEKVVRDVRPNTVNFGFEYPTMNEAELAAFDVGAMAHDDCHLFCWTTQKHLPIALRLIEAWGFKYVLCMVWHKSGGFQPYNLPQYNCEFAIYARRGAPEFVDTKAFFTCFEAPRREHSRKPDEFYAVIERVTPGPRIDVFSREARAGFDQFGNETEKFVA
jgi:N6-adenosine-specific RNA methylase IME4/ParB-like chromosome segregation protein Spo0J